MFFIDNEQYGQDNERQEECEICPDSEHVPLLVVTVADQALCLEVHAALVEVDPTELTISEAAVA